jgi:hypothetical protein
MNHVNFEHRVFSVFKKGLQHAPRDLIFYQYYKLDKVEPASVIADYDDATGTPLLVEKVFGEGRGKVLLWNNTVDGDWNAGIVGRPPYLPVMRSAMEHLSSRPAERKNLMIGDFLQHTMTVDQYQPVFVLDTPGEGQISISPTAPKSDDKFITVHYPVRRPTAKPEDVGKKPLENEGLKFAGRYTLAKPQTKEDERPVSYFACNLPPKSVTPEEMLRLEGNLDRIGDDELTRRFPDFKFELVGKRTRGGEMDVQRDPGHLWKYLLYLLAAFLVLESVLAWLFGRAKQ